MHPREQNPPENSLHVKVRKRLTSDRHGTFLLDVDFIARPGITILFGPSGSGKTTILQAVVGLLTPDAGSIRIGDEQMFDNAARVDLPVNRRNIGYVFQNLALFPHLTVEQNIQYGLAGLDCDEKQRRTQEVLDSFHIPHLVERRPSEISGGERQRVALARALVMQPRVLLLDEPMSALDGVTKAKIMDDLRAWNEIHHIPILYVTHGRREVFALGEHVVALEQGTILAEGTPQVVLEAPRHELLAQLAGFENIFDATVIAHHDAHGTMTCRLLRRIKASAQGDRAEGSAVIESEEHAVDLEAPLVRIGDGVPVRLAIRAGDILLSTERPHHLSARNVVTAKLVAMAREGVMVIAEAELANRLRMTVDITPSAVESLQLEIGKPVWLVIKTYSCHLLQRRDEDTVPHGSGDRSGGGMGRKEPSSKDESYIRIAPKTGQNTGFPRLKILYLLAVTAAVFAIPAFSATQRYAWYAVPSLLMLQVILLMGAQVTIPEILRACLRLKWLFLFLLATYVLVPGDRQHDVLFVWQPLANLHALTLDITGLRLAGMMCFQIATIILVSAVVRLTGSGTDFIDGLRGFGFPQLFVYSIDYTLALLGGLSRRGIGGRGAGTGDGRGRHRDPSVSASENSGFRALLKKITAGDVGFFTQSVQQSMARAREHVQRESQGKMDSRMAHDVAVITGISLMMMTMKMLKILPGVPFFSGFKTLLLYPLYILAADLTYSRWGGTVCGTIMGVLGFLQGDGRYGAMEILKHAAPGFTIDLSWPLVRRFKRSIWLYCVLGCIVAIARTSTEFATVLLLRPRDEILLFPFAKLIPNLIAGTLSGFVTFFILPAFRGAEATTKTTLADASPGSSASNPTNAAPTPSAVAADALRGSGAGFGVGSGTGGGRGRGSGDPGTGGPGMGGGGNGGGGGRGGGRGSGGGGGRNRE